MNQLPRALPIVPTPLSRRSFVAGVAGTGLLLGTYLAIIALAQGPRHAVQQLASDAGFVLPLAAGFGVQVALFLELRAVDRRHRASAAVTAAGTGTSAAAMLACCAHHLVDLLPFVGLSAAAVFLEAYKTPLFLVAIAFNLVGIGLIGRRLANARRACAPAGAAPMAG